jgi:GNAT superfamily N-acetyltransferase
MAPIIRRMIEADIPQVLLLLQNEWDCEETHTSLPQELRDMFSTASFRPTYFVAEHEDRIVACAGWNWGWFNYDNFEFFWMCVDEPYRGRGLGKSLVDARISDVMQYKKEGRPLYIWISTPLRERYEKFGFRVILETPRVFVRGQQAYAMVKEINQ